jgi:hypothetical protein
VTKFSIVISIGKYQEKHLSIYIKGITVEKKEIKKSEKSTKET